MTKCLTSVGRFGADFRIGFGMNGAAANSDFTTLFGFCLMIDFGEAAGGGGADRMGMHD